MHDLFFALWKSGGISRTEDSRAAETLRADIDAGQAGGNSVKGSVKDTLVVRSSAKSRGRDACQGRDQARLVVRRRLVVVPEEDAVEGLGDELVAALVEGEVVDSGAVVVQDLDRGGRLTVEGVDGQFAEGSLGGVVE